MKNFLAGLLALTIVFGTAGTITVFDEPLFAHKASADAAEDLPMSGKCGENVTWKLDDDGTLTISGTGEMTDYQPKATTGPYVGVDTGFPAPPWYLREDIKKVIFSDGITHIGDNCLMLCKKLESVSIPDSVTSIGTGAFLADMELTDINIPSSVTKFGGAVFRGTGWAYELEKNDPLIIVNDIVVEAQECKGDVVIPDGVKCIASSAFVSAVNVTSISVPDSVTEIGQSAFYGCTNMKKITLPKGLKKIESMTLSDCWELTEITIPDTVTDIEDMAFGSCYKIDTITVPKSVTKFGHQVMGYEYDSEAKKFVKHDGFTIQGYRNSVAETYANDNEFKFVALDSDDVPTSGKCGENVTWKLDADGTLTISGKGKMQNPFYYKKDGVYYPYSDLEKYTKKVVIEEGVTYLTDFNSWDDLEEIVIPESCTEFSSGFARGTPWLEKMRQKDPLVIVNGVLVDCSEVKDKELVIPDGVTLSQGPIFGDNKIITKIVLPSTIKEIPSYAFNGMSALEEIIIPQSVTSVGVGAFWNCKNLKKVEFPDNIKSLSAVFNGCDSLEEVVLPKNLQEIKSFGFDALSYGLFGNCPKLKTVIIPESVTLIEDTTLGFDYTYKDGIVGDVEVKKIDDFTIQGLKGSAAEKYAKANGFKFLEIKKVPVLKGDVNGDKEINVTDIAVTASHIKGIKPLDEAGIKSADVNSDGNINVTDIAMIASHIKGIKALG